MSNEEVILRNQHVILKMMKETICRHSTLMVRQLNAAMDETEKQLANQNEVRGDIKWTP